jgi:hypothetical protein
VSKEASVYVGLRAEPDNGPEDFNRRLRAFPKCAIRSFRLRATVLLSAPPKGCEEVKEESEAGK